MNDWDHNESDRTDISQQNIGSDSYVTRYGRVITRYGRVIKNSLRFGDT